MGLLLFGCILLGFAGLLRAASITWSAPAAIATADATLNQTGYVISAAAWGNPDTIVTLSNGQTIDFTIGTINGGGGVVADANPEAGVHFGANFSGTGNANFDNVLNGFAYDGNNPVITLQGLTVGQNYSIQLFGVDDRGGASARTEAFSDGSNQSSTFTLGDNQYVIGTFTASAATQTINVVGVGQQQSNINALVLRNTSIPSNGPTWNIPGDGSWASGSNWTGGTAPHNAGDTAIFGAANPAAAATVTLDGSQAIGTLVLNNAHGVSITPGSGGTLFFDNGANAANVQVLAGSHTISTAVALNSSTTIGSSRGAQLTISGAISGGSGLTATGSGALKLSGGGTFAGGLTINGGTVTITAPQNFGGVTIIQGGTLRLGNAPSTAPAGSAYHLDAINASSLVTSGSSVTQWNDLSGNGRNFTQNSDAAPTLVSNGINGHAAIQFNGANQSLNYAGGNVNAQTVFIVNTSTSDGGNINGIWGQFGGDNGIRLASNSQWHGSPDGGGDSNDFSNNANGSTWITTANSFDANTTSFGSPGTPMVLAATGNATYGNTGLGRYFYGGRYWAGDIGEVLVYSTQLTAADRQAVEAYLSAKWLGGSSSLQNNMLPTSTFVNLTGSGATLDLGYGSTTQTIGSLGGVAGSNVALGGNALIVGGDGTSTQFDGLISGAGGSLVKTGAGTMILTGTHTYTGGTSVSGGALQLGNGTTRNGSVVGNIALANNSTLIFANPSAQTFSGATSGSGSVTKTGPGTLALTGANSHSGGLTVNGGVVSIAATQSYGGATIIQTGTLRIGDTPSALPVGAAYHLDATNAASLVTSGSAVTQWNDLSGNGRNFVASETPPTLVNSGINGHAAIQFNGSSTSLNYAGNVNAQTVFIVNTSTSDGGNINGIWGWYNHDNGIRLANASQWRGSPDGGGDGNDFTNTSGGSTWITTASSFDANTTSFGPSGTPMILAATGNQTYDNTGLGEYFYNGVNPKRYWAGNIGEVVVYGSQFGAGDRASVEQYLGVKWFGATPTSQSNVLPTGTFVNLTGAGATLDLGYLPTTQTIGSLGGVAGSNVMLGGGTLIVGGDGTSTEFDGAISGVGGSLVKTGGGTMILTGPHTYTGGTSVIGGALQLGNGTSRNGSVVGNIVLSNNSSLVFANPNSQTFSGAASGSGSLTKTGAGTLALTGNNSHSGGLTVNGGVLYVANSQTYGGATTIQSGALRLATAPAAPVANGLQYQLDASSAANLSLSGANVTAWNDSSGHGVNFTQGTPGNQPTYLASGISGLGSVSFNGSSSKLVGNFSTGVQTVFIVNQPTGYSGLDGIFGQDNGDFGIRLASSTAWQNPGNSNDLSNGGAMFINGVQAGGNGAFVAGQPQLLEVVSAGANNFTAGLGQYFYNAGQRAFNGQIGEVLVYNGQLSAPDQAAVNAYLTAKWLTGAPIYNSNNILPTATDVSLTGSGATLDLGTGVTTQTIGSLAGVSGSAVQLGGNTLVVGGNGGATQFDGVISGAGSLVKTGVGRLTLTAASTYSGGTTVSSGTLRVQNYGLPATSIIVNSPGVLQYDTSTITSGNLEQQRADFSGSGTLLVTGGNVVRFGAFAGNTINWNFSAGALINVQSGTMVGGTFNNDNWSNNRASLTVAQNAAFQMVEANVNVDALNGGGSISGGYNGTSTLTVGVAGGGGTFSGSLSDDTGSGGRLALLKTGAGTQVLAAIESYSGGTTVNNGTLRTTVGGAAPGSTGSLGSGPLAINAAGVTTSVNLGGNETVNGFSASQSSSGVANLSVAGGHTLTVNSAATTRVTGALNIGGGGVAAVNSNQINLANNATLNISGATTLKISSGGSANSTVGTGVLVTVASGSTLELAGSVSALTDPTAMSGSATNPAKRAAIQVDGALLVDAAPANQEVGGIDPFQNDGGSVILADLNGGNTANLVADHVNLNSLVIGNGATFALAASNASGAPLASLGGGSYVSGSAAPANGSLATRASLRDTRGSAKVSRTMSLGGGLGGTTSAVPEPSTVVLLLLAGAGLKPLLRLLAAAKDSRP